ncbi:FAD-binding monooxygenase [Streptomyces pharetrae CZA14]|uniref:FAD-binding monooxygenase n=1 Tax=Streptomyces pharetrae CZA14 TaxID=1144883 RepID=A0ABX3Y8Q7_9ACTN|nr:FAD-binding monooxygenase [Streptomyces pharetrae CZA14]
MRVKVACVGGGPAGLYLSILLKLQDPSHEITVHERNPEGSTYGWGVTYWRGLLDRLHLHDPESARALDEHSVRWNEGVAHIGDRTVRHTGDQGFGIGRHQLLEILAARARSLGVRLEYAHEVTADRLPDADLVVAADGVRSALRTRYADHFGTEVTAGRNPYVWLGTTKAFDAFTFGFTETDHGWIWCYGYAYGPDRGTCVVECAPETLAGLGLDRADEAEGLILLEKLFADVLDGHRLIGRSPADGSAPWRTFRTLTNRTWYRDNLVLVGDAAHTTHYSVGAGTTLALEDAIALAGALRELPTLPQALARYERERKAALLPAQSAARYSAQWYENLPRYLRLPPEQMFALLGQRHSPLLPHLPPRLYHRLDLAAGRLVALRRFKRWLGPKIARVAHTRTRAGRRG